MKHPLVFPAAVLAAAFATGFALWGGALAMASDETAPSRDDAVAYGKYIVHSVSMCTDCHSPRDERGAFIEAKHLTGSPLGFKPVVEMPWMPMAPRLAGLPDGYTAEDLIRYLMTGERPNGMPGTLPPMPEYRMARADAEAVTAYLASLKPLETTASAAAAAQPASR